MKKIQNRDDVYFLVSKFYEKVRLDELIGPVFNQIIPNDHWPFHLQKLTDFWETNLFGVRKFKGNPSLAHQMVDRKTGYIISQKHFGRWLELWFETIDSHFTGNRAVKAKESARRMATGQFMMMYQNRQNA